MNYAGLMPVYPLVMTNIANWKMGIEVVSFPMHVKLPEGKYMTLHDFYMQLDTFQRNSCLDVGLGKWNKIERDHLVRPLM